MNLNALHRRLMQDVLEIGNSLPLVITGGYAVQAHQLVDRLREATRTNSATQASERALSRATTQPRTAHPSRPDGSAEHSRSATRRRATCSRASRP